jgi:hypothetical protein
MRAAIAQPALLAHDLHNCNRWQTAKDRTMPLRQQHET